MKIINIEEIPNSHLNDELNTINSYSNNENENENKINQNVDDYDLNVDNITDHQDDDDNEEDEEDTTVIINYDGYIFDNFEEECQNNLCKAKINKKNLDKFPRGLFIGGEVALCFICYISGYRPCMNTHLIMHSDDMECINNFYYYKCTKL
jgi:hypothetical protein